MHLTIRLTRRQLDGVGLVAILAALVALAFLLHRIARETEDMELDTAFGIPDADGRERESESAS